MEGVADEGNEGEVWDVWRDGAIEEVRSQNEQVGEVEEGEGEQQVEQPHR